MEQILGNIQSTIIFIIVLSILVVVHEWGHFITAKKLGVKVDRFALGFGPKLWSMFHDGTEFLVCAIPLGGYVKMAGDERTDCKGTPEEFYSKSPGHRALIVVNGPVVNYVLAYLVFVLCFMIGFPGPSTKIYEVKAGSPAEQAGIRAGDQVIGIDSEDVYGEIKLDRVLEGDSKKPMAIRVRRDGQEQTFTVTPNVIERKDLLGELKDFRDLGVGFDPSIIGYVLKDGPAEQAGLKAEDLILEIDGSPVSDFPSVQKGIEKSTGEFITLKVKRKEETLTVSLKPRIDELKDESGISKQVRRIGIGPARNLDLHEYGLLKSIRYGYDELIFLTVMTYKSIAKLFTGSISAKESVAGPIGIFVIVKGAAEEGFSNLLYILAAISASLAIFNLLPVIPLDGGHLFLLGLERIRGRALPPKIDEYVAKVGFTLIILLAVFVFYVDFDRFGFFEKIKELFS